MRWWLDWHRDALLLCCEGLSAEQLRERSVPPSNLSLLGLLRHMTLLERIYWRRIFLGDTSIPIPDDDDGADFNAIDDLDPPTVFDEWRTERRFADEILDTTPFDAIGAGGQTVRFWVLKLMNEYARHNGHADLIRETIDGTVGE